MSKKIWILRWVFDPIHEGHHSNMMSSISWLKLDLLNIIVKFLWEKDPNTSIQQRIDMIHLQIWETDKIKVIKQNIQWHLMHLLELKQQYKGCKIINTCWSDKINRELKVYWQKWDIVGVLYRPEFWFPSDMEDIAKFFGIDLIKIYPEFSSSSTFIRKELIKNRDNKPNWLNYKVYNYIIENDLYIPNHFSFKEYEKYWNNFIQFVNSFYPSLNLHDLEIPNFNVLQHKDAWKEKFINYIVKEKKLEQDELVFFVNNALKFKM